MEAAASTRSERRSWRLHRRIADLLDADALDHFRPRLEANLRRATGRFRDEPHLSRLAEWADLVAASDLPAIHRALTGLDRHSIEMREVSPFAGFLTEEQRLAALAEDDRCG